MHRQVVMGGKRGTPVLLPVGSSTGDLRACAGSGMHNTANRKYDE